MDRWLTTFEEKQFVIIVTFHTEICINKFNFYTRISQITLLHVYIYIQRRFKRTVYVYAYVRNVRKHCIPEKKGNVVTGGKFWFNNYKYRLEL